MCDICAGPRTKSGDTSGAKRAAKRAWNEHKRYSRAETRAAGFLGNYKGLCTPGVFQKTQKNPDKITPLRLQRFGAQNVDHGGLKSCLWNLGFKKTAVEVKGQQSEVVEGQYDKTRFGNLAVCGSHICPVCGPRIANRRRGEVEQAVTWGQSEGFIPVLLTLTTQHTAEDRLDDLIRGQRAAFRKMKRHRKYQKIRKRFPHMISAFEENHGQSNGWHPHIHVVVFVEAKTVQEAARLVASLRPLWKVSAEAEDLVVGRAGFKVTISEDTPEATAAKAARYVTKEASSWGLAEEMTLTHHKKGEGSRTPQQLLKDGYEGDEQALSLWQVWVKAVKGRSVLRFSPGLKAAAGIGEVDDKEAAGEAPEEKKEKVIYRILPDTWDDIKKRGLCRDTLLEEAKKGRKAILEYLATLFEKPR